MTWVRRAGWAVLALVVLWGTAWLAVPPLLKSQAEQRFSALLGRTVSIGKVDFKPWTLELTLSGLVVAAAAGAPATQPVLRVERLYVDADIRSLLRLAPVIEALQIDAPQVHVTRTAPGHYDIDDLLARFTQPDPAKQPGELPRFALYNLQLRNGSLVVDDRAMAGRRHELNALQLELPFLSNLASQVAVKVEPRLAFKLNGAAFDSGAQATPFAQTRAAHLKLAVAELDLTPYLGYVPATLPVRLVRGTLSTDLALNFEMPPGAPARVSLKGRAAARGIALQDRAGAPLVDWKSFEVALRDVQPLERKLVFGAVGFDGLQVHLGRDAQGRVNLQQLGQGSTVEPKPPVPAPSAAAAAGSASGSVSESASATRDASGSAWRVGVDSFELANSGLLWTDASARPAASLVLGALQLKTGSLQWPLAKEMQAHVAASLRGPGANAAELGRVGIDFKGDDSAAQVKLQLNGLALQALEPYFAPVLKPRLSGLLSANAAVDWAAARGAGAQQIKLRLAQATLETLRVVDAAARGKTALASLAKLELADVDVDLKARTLTLGSVKIDQPGIDLTRDAEGRWNVQQWLVATSPARAGPKPARPGQVAADGPAWRVQLRELSVAGGRLRYADSRPGIRTPAVPVRLELTALKLGLQNFTLQGGKTSAAAKLQLSASVVQGAAAPTLTRASAQTPARARAQTNRAGSVDWRGQFGLEPLLAKGTLRLTRFPVQALEPYFGDALNVSLLRAEAGYQGDVSVQGTPGGMSINAAGDVLVGDVMVHSKPDADPRAAVAATDELLSWQSLTLKGLKVAMLPRQRPKIEVREAALSDFYSRLIITEQGRFNLQDVAPQAADAASAPAVAASAPSPALAAVATAASSAASSPAVAETSALDIVVGATRLNNGRVDFSDRFVRPNYSVTLTELNGGLGEFRSGTREMATLELRGKAAGTALLEIVGKLNPTAKPLALDLRARATDLELAPLSPYAGKYAGYAIERGKLSVDVSYKIDADGKLDAKNQVTLNQLTFGEKIDSSSATKLPVLLAVALLKDRNGVIDINLPVSGSINDPQFSVFAIVLKIIGNLLVKAFTSPFALLSGGSGGADDLSLVGFTPGTARVTDAGRGTLSKVVKALTDRPALNMTVTGAADPMSERDAYAQAVLEARLLAEHKRESVSSGAAADAAVAFDAQDRARVLKEVYKDTEIANKPRNAVGFARDIPGPEMEALLKTRIVVSTEAMRELALQRGLAVRDALLAQGLPKERLFLAAPKLHVGAEGDAAWSPRVQLTLAAN